MKTDTMRRTAILAAITLLALYLIYPTVRYFLGVSGRVPATEEQLASLRARSVPLGLDLQGGVDVLLAVDSAKTRSVKIEDFAEQIRRQFSKEQPVIEGSVEATSGTESIQIKVNRPEQVRVVDNILTTLKNDGIFPDYNSGTVRAGEALALKVNNDLLAQDITKTIDSSIKVIRDRVDSLGVTQPIVVKQGQDRIRVQIPGQRDPQKAISTIIKPAQLEFRGVYTGNTPQPGSDVYSDISNTIIDMQTGKVLADKQIPPGYEARSFKRVTQTPKADAAAEPLQPTFTLVKKQPEMTGAGLKDARMYISSVGLEAGQVQVLVEFNREGTKKFAAISEKYLKKPLAVLLDGVVQTAPVIQTIIDQGSCQISGSFTQEEATNLALILKAGALPAELVTKDMRTVEATLGTDSIQSSLFALLIGSIFVGIFMIAYYGIGGLIAVVAVILHSLMIFAFMKLGSVTLTLSGIGGVLLTVAMAVDANILIYERIREELHSGKSMKQAIQIGFARAYTVIFDANLTAMISGLVLLQFGEGSVKGFALSLIIGILVTMYTGLFVTRTLVQLWYEKFSNLGFGKFAWFRDGAYYDFIHWRKFTYIFSIILFVGSALYVMPFKPFAGSNWGVDFEGGLLSEVEVTSKPMTTQEVAGSHTDWRVQKVAGKNHFLVRTKSTDDSQTLNSAKTETAARLDETIGKGNYQIVSSEAVSTEVGAEFTQKALLACIVASIAILIYIGFRFEFAFGLATVIALFHDLVITYGLFNLLSRFGFAGEVTLDVVAALLVVLGTSVNDTIVIFDRVRENKRLYPALPDRELINRSISESLNRTVMSVAMVVIVLVVMLIWGGHGLYDFALILLIGIVKGTYSSSFVAAPLLYELHERARRKGKQVRLRDTSTKSVRPMLQNKA